MAQSFFNPTVSNCFSLSLAADYLCPNNNSVNLIFKNIGNKDYDSSIYSYDNSTGYVTLLKKGKYLFLAHLTLSVSSAVSSGSLTVRYGSGEFSSYSSDLFSSAESKTEFDNDLSLIVTSNGSTVAYLSMQNSTNQAVRAIGVLPSIGQKPTFIQLIYLGP